jgi:hypothetical protein
MHIDGGAITMRSFLKRPLARLIRRRAADPRHKAGLGTTLLSRIYLLLFL